MKFPRLSCLVLLLTLSVPAAFGGQGRMIGEEEFTIPAWFKLSFLDIQEDVREAGEAGKHVMLFMHVDRCPYCTRSLDENFHEGANKEFMQKHFDVIAINIRGSKQVAWDKQTSFSEKQLAADLGVIATPTIVFLNEKGKKVYQMNGYRKPAAFRHVLEYVKDRQYEKMSLVKYVEQKNEARYSFRSHDLFKNLSDFSKAKGPVAVIFEDKGCADCDEFHREVLAHKDVISEMKKLTIVRLDARSDKSIIDFKGKQTTPRDWAQELKLDYRPGTVVFDAGREWARADGRLYHFHYKEMLRYVSSSAYIEYPTWLHYLPDRMIEILNEGKDIDFAR